MSPAIPAVTGRDDNKHLTRACWLIVSEHKDRHGAPPKGLYFNKALSLLHRRLQDAGQDLRLPHCWYLYGDEVVRHWIPSPVLWDHDVTTNVQWVGHEPPRPDDRLGKAMAETLDGILKEFSAAEHIEEMVDKVYEYAPFGFQRAYRQVRRANYDAGQSLLDPESIAAVTAGLVREAATIFPHDEFGQASFYAKSAFTAATATLESDASKLELVREALEKFWEYWCHFLRLHPDAHENVPGSTLKLWKEKIRPQETEYAIVFRSHLEDMLDVAPRLRDEEILQPWIARIDRSDDEAAHTIDHWTSVLEGVDEFVQSEKAGYAA